MLQIISKIKLISLIIYLLFLSNIYAQNTRMSIQHLGIDEGLSHSLVKKTVIDDNGFLWIATQNGLNRYDGYKFRTYFAGKSNKTPRKNNFSKIISDSHRQLWICYVKGGLDRFDLETGTFHYYPNLTTSESNKNVLFEDSKLDMWIGSSRGVSLYNRQSDDFKLFPFNPNSSNSLSNNNVNCISEDKFGYIWVGTDDGIRKIEKSTGRIQRILSSSTHPEFDKLIVTDILFQDNDLVLIATMNMGLISISANNNSQTKYTQYIDEFIKINNEIDIYELYKTSKGKILLRTSSGLYEIQNVATGILITRIETLEPISIKDIEEDSKGYIWVIKDQNTNNNTPQLYRFDENLNNYELFGNRPSINKLGNVPINNVYTSGTGLVYIGTVKQGLFIINTNAKKFGIIDTTPQNGLYITNNDVYSIYEDNKNNLWVGTSKELNKIDLNNKTMYNFSNKRTVRHDISYNYSDKLESRLIGSIVETKDHNFWFGSFDYKVSYYKPETNTFINFHQNENDSSSYTGWSLRTIMTTRSGEIYFGGSSVELCKLNTDGLSFSYFHDSDKSNTSSVNNIIEDKNNVLWLATKKGLKSFTPKTKKFKKYISDYTEEIRVILEPKVFGKDILWLGTDDGLKKFDLVSGTYETFSIKNGIPNNTILGIVEDNEGYLWLSTLNGLARFNPVNYEVNVYKVEDGIQSNEFNEGAYFKNKKGIIYFGGNKGITFFDPKIIGATNNDPGKVILTGFKINQQYVNENDTINGRVILNKNISYTDKLYLNHKDDLISIEFATSNHLSPADIKYRYKLEGYDKDWNIVNSDNRVANYSYLKSGDYTLYVDCTNKDNIWSEKPTRLKINILPPIWESFWFKLVGAIFALLLITFFFIIYTRRLKHQKYLLEKEVKERTIKLEETNLKLKLKHKEFQKLSKKIHKTDLNKLRFFTNISHEFRTPLSLILSPIDKLVKFNNYEDVNIVKHNLKIIDRNAKRLYNLITQLLELPKAEAGVLALKVSKEDIIIYTNEILNLFKEYALTKNIKISFLSNLKQSIVYFDNDKIEKILYNLLSNAINYTPVGGTVELFISEPEESLNSKYKMCICVKDSGKGIEKDKLGYIFDRFYQIENSQTSKNVNSGIGLSLVKSTVDVYKGEIKVISEINKGTTFKVFLPTEKDSFNTEEFSTTSDIEYNYNYSKSMLLAYTPENIQKIDEKEITKGSIKHKIVIVEDNKDLNEFLYNELKEHYEVITAFNGKEGLYLIRKHLPSLVLSDIAMPAMNGITMCNEVKKDTNTSHIPVFLLTAKTAIDHQIEGLNIGADDYISKPFNVDLLKLRIYNSIKAKEAYKAKFTSNIRPVPKGITINEIDDDILEKIIQYVEDNIETNLTADLLADELGFSKSNLYKKLNNLTGLSVNIFIRNIRLNVAGRLLEQGNYSISEVAFSTGFSNPKYFSSCFTKYHGKTPKDFRK